MQVSRENSSRPPANCGQKHDPGRYPGTGNNEDIRPQNKGGFDRYNIVNESALMNAAAKMTIIHREAKEKLDRVSSGHNKGTIVKMGDLTHGLESRNPLILNGAREGI